MGYPKHFFSPSGFFWQALFEAPALILLLKGLGDEGAARLLLKLAIEIVIYPAIKWWIFPWLCEAKYQRVAGTLGFNGIEWELHHGIEWDSE